MVARERVLTGLKHRPNFSYFGDFALKSSVPGLPDFSLYKIPKTEKNGHKIYHAAMKHTKWLCIIPRGNKI
jgi:hypothetical protein